MAGEKSVKLHNKSDKPDNIVLKEHEIVSKCEEIQDQLPGCFKGFFRYLKGNVLSKTRVAYLGDIASFLPVSHRRDGSDRGGETRRHKKRRF